MSKKPLKVTGVAMRRAPVMTEALATTAPQGPVNLAFDIENPNDKPLHVWASRRAYDYDAATHVLTLYLTEHVPDLPPGIKMISDHPRTPVQVEVKAKNRGTIPVTVPAIIRRRVPGKGLGMAFVEERIGQIDRVDIHVQYADEPLPQISKESPAEHRKRLLAHGDVVHATITPTGQKEQ